MCHDPQLQKITHLLHQEIKKADRLSAGKDLYDQFYSEIDKVIKCCEEIKN